MSAPVAVLTIITLTLVFEAFIIGDDFEQPEFPSFEQPETGGFWGALDAILAVVKAIWTGLVYFFNLLTFNIPGAPWYVRLMATTVLGGALIWSIIGLIRGGGND